MTKFVICGIFFIGLVLAVNTYASAPQPFRRMRND